MSDVLHPSHAGWPLRALAPALMMTITIACASSPAHATAPPPLPADGEGMPSRGLVAASLALGAAGIAVGLAPPASDSSRALRGATSLALELTGLVTLGVSRSNHQGTPNDVLSYLAVLSDVSAIALGVTMWHREPRPRAVAACVMPTGMCGGFCVALLARF